MMRNGIDLDKPEIRGYCKKWKIRTLSVFGSYLRDDFRPDSDIDFLVEFEDSENWNLFDLFHMKDELEQIVGRKVDFIDRGAIEDHGNPFLCEEIFGTAEPVYAKR